MFTQKTIEQVCKSLQACQFKNIGDREDFKKLLEEQSEFNQALFGDKAKPKDLEKVIEESTDAIIMILKMVMRFSVAFDSDEADSINQNMSEWLDFKVNRTIERVNSDYYKKG